MHRIPFELRSQAASGVVSTKVGDRLGSPRADSPFFISSRPQHYKVPQFTSQLTFFVHIPASRSSDFLVPMLYKIQCLNNTISNWKPTGNGFPSIWLNFIRQNSTFNQNSTEPNNIKSNDMEKIAQTKIRKSPAAFLRKTFDILMKGEHNDVICWTQDGHGFVIKDLDRFEKEILPVYFKHHQITSFVRQLNMYGFRKCRHAQDGKTFMHAKFSRDQNCLADIKRRPESKKKVRRNRRKHYNLNNQKPKIQVSKKIEQNSEEVFVESNEEIKEEVIYPSIDTIYFYPEEMRIYSEHQLRIYEQFLIQSRAISPIYTNIHQIICNQSQSELILPRQSLPSLDNLYFPYPIDYPQQLPLPLPLTDASLQHMQSHPLLLSQYQPPKPMPTTTSTLYSSTSIAPSF